MRELIKFMTPSTVIGIGAIKTISEKINSFRPNRVLILTDEGLVKAGIMDSIMPYLNDICCEFEIYEKCETEPTISGIELIAQQCRDKKIDLLVGIGGGSVMDATKVVSLIAANEGITIYDLINGQEVERTINKILIPTTAGTGSEWSRTAVVSDDKADKMTRLILTPKNYSDAVIIDPELTLNLPPRITAETGIDALTHCLEGYWSVKSNVLSDMINGTAIQLIAENLRPAYFNGTNNVEARFNMAIAAALAIQGAGLSGAPLVHAMNNPFGKKVHISHGTTCGLLLPHAMRFTFRDNPEKFAQIAQMMGKDVKDHNIIDKAEMSVEAVREVIRDIKMPTTLAEATDIELTDDDISLMAEQVAQSLPMLNERNPRPVTVTDVLQIYRSAIWGEKSS